MSVSKHIFLSVPEDWDSNRKGTFYEEFISDLLIPMRLRIVSRVRVTGMEIDVLAKDEDQPRTILVECKAYRDPLPSEAISKLMGNVWKQQAEAGWLFSSSDLGKDAKGYVEEIRSNPDQAKKFAWFPPERIAELLIAQNKVVDPLTLLHHLEGWAVGDWTLVIAPGARTWLAQLIENGIPSRFTVFDATNGKPLALPQALQIANLSPRFGALSPLQIDPVISPTPKSVQGQVARVISADKWYDLRPARPVDFVGRDDIIHETVEFISQVQSGKTNTRTFAIAGPSGWGKSSLILKLCDLVSRGKLPRCSLSAVDARSAANSSFVSASVREAFLDAAKYGLLPSGQYRVESIRHPLDSPDIAQALELLYKSRSCIVLLIDQFEELLFKEELFEVFSAAKDLSLDIDGRGAPLILGFAWKTDISPPQMHPAYHMWHDLADRRCTFKIREFGSKDIGKIIGKTERAAGKKLSPALRARITEQCNNLPWWLKKLLVHVLQRITDSESQYMLLERELDVETLFKEDLQIPSEQVKCLKYIATRAPVIAVEVDECFPREITTGLINSNLLVRSGMNYVIYWDLFRDYLIDERNVPHIPWARTFRYGPNTALTMLHKLGEMGPMNVQTVAEVTHKSEGTCFNIISDLTALQLVESKGNGVYGTASHLSDLSMSAIAKCVQSQLRRHVVVSELVERFELGKVMDFETWFAFFAEVSPQAPSHSRETIRSYAKNMRRWLVFAGILEEQGRWFLRSAGNGRQMGIIASSPSRSSTFLGTTAPSTLERLLLRLQGPDTRMERRSLAKEGLRNAVADAIALGIVIRYPDGSVGLTDREATLLQTLDRAKLRVLEEPATRIILEALGRGTTDGPTLGVLLQKEFGLNWKPASSKRYANGIRRYLAWAGGISLASKAQGRLEFAKDQ